MTTDAALAAAMPLARRSMTDAVAERIATLIASGALTVGDALPAERHLAAGMDVSRETVRGAIIALKARGVLSVTQGARTKVASDDLGDLGLSALSYGRVTHYELDDVHVARLTVEGRVAVLAAARISPADLARLEGLIAAQETAMGDPLRYLIADREFHALIYRASGNAVLSDMAAMLYSYMLGARRRVVARPGAIPRSIDDHRAILAALRAGDGGALASAFGVHERRIYETTRQIMAKSRAANEGTTGGVTT